MDMTNPMSLLLIEDDKAECEKFKACAGNRDDVTFIGITGSCKEGLHYLQTHSPEGIILDLMLHEGQGSGLQFLVDLQNMDLSFRPLIIVTTHIPSPIICSHVLNAGVDFVYHKGQTDYSPELVINTFSTLRNALYATRSGNISMDLRTVESPEEQGKRVSNIIDTELDLVGVSVRYKGRICLRNAIYLLIYRKIGDSSSVIEQVAQSLNRDYSSVIRAMQTAIKNTWNSASVDDLCNHYKARTTSNTGIPTAAEFIHYYADKIRRKI
jgi:DNA-binding NarL/FixJ family response regulator